ncbi:hypothetical protein L9F63_024742 [Diploptera punctata]|uniref:Uncharacterized protein n=1 Tax=Diploptera punctata TaxID=6984 RepID=A0AAD7ZF28_DIPPU|nr:hypothetical protein L9F63_024742 [Diploptera punctata]
MCRTPKSGRLLQYAMSEQEFGEATLSKTQDRRITISEIASHVGSSAPQPGTKKFDENALDTSGTSSLQSRFVTLGRGVYAQLADYTSSLILQGRHQKEQEIINIESLQVLLIDFQTCSSVLDNYRSLLS